MEHIPEKGRYDGASIVFHWLTAALVLLLWLMAQSEALLPREWRHGMWSFHVTTGTVLVLIYCARLLWLMSSATRPVSINAGALRLAERITHGLLYALLATALVLGIVNVAARGWDLFGVVQIPGFAPNDRALRRSINGWHELAANALLCLAAVHAVAALYHQFVRRDGLLNRMWFTRRKLP
jgi:cytochrome b561